MPTPSWTISSITLIASNSPAKACVGPKQSNRGRLDPTPQPVTTILRPARLATRAASFRYGGRHHSGIPGGIIPLHPGDFVGIGTQWPPFVLTYFILHQPTNRKAGLGADDMKIDIAAISLDVQNFRHGKASTERKALRFLLSDERTHKVAELAQDIVTQKGLDPSSLLIVTE